MGVPVAGPAHMFADNLSVIMSSTIPHSALTKRHNALSYHRVRECVASDILRIYHIAGTENPADVLTKFLPYPAFWHLIQPLLFWRGDTTWNPSLRGVTRRDPVDSFSSIPLAITAGTEDTVPMHVDASETIDPGSVVSNQIFSYNQRSDGSGHTVNAAVDHIPQ